MSAVVRAALVALLVAGAGCSAVFGPSTPSPVATPTETLTPAPDAAPTPTPAYPPGVAATGVTDAFALVEAHEAALANASFTVVEVRTLRYANGSLVRNRTERSRIATTRGRYRYRRTVNGTVDRPRRATTTVYSNGTVAVRRSVTSDRDDAQYEFAARGPNGGYELPPAPATPLNGERLVVLLNRVNATVAGGDRTVELRATGYRGDEPVDFLARNVANVTLRSFTARVGPGGLVREYRLVYEGTVDGEPVVAVERVRYEAVGNTTVSEPPWFDTAMDSLR